MESFPFDSRLALRRLDEARLGPFHTRLLLVTGYCWLWAGYAVTIIGYIIPVLRGLWPVNATQLGLIASATMAGMMPGSVLAGALADRFGRRTTLAWTMLYLAVTSLACALAWDYPSLLALRLINGVGMGAVLPTASTLVSEYSPARYRGRLLVLLNGFWGLGGAVSALVGYGLIPRFGWKAGLLCGALAITTLPLVLRFVPESLRFLIGQRRWADLRATLRAVDPGEAAEAVEPPLDPAPEAAAATPTPARPGLRPWSQPYRGRTLSLWFMWIALNFMFQGVFVWLPSVLIAAGHSPERASLLALVINLGQVPGTLVAASLADALSRRRSVMGFLALLGASSALFGLAHSPFWVVFWGFAVAIGLGALWGMAYPFTTELYPTEIRGAATGWSTGVGRIGGMSAPLLVGALLTAGASNGTIFSILGIMPFLTIAVLLGVRQETTGKTLEEID